MEVKGKDKRWLDSYWDTYMFLLSIIPKQFSLLSALQFSLLKIFAKMWDFYYRYWNSQ